jgi:ribosomal protein S18 acetylase RimI-like enzyme
VAEIRDATWDDFDDVVDLLAARSRAAFGTSEVKAEHVRQRWELPGFDRGWVAVEGGRVVGHASLDSTQDATVAAADPAAGDALLARVEERARERGFPHVAITAVRDDVPLWELVERNGLELEREFFRMWRPLDGDLPEPQWPDGVAVRSYADADATAVHALLDEAYAGWDRDYVARDHPGWLAFMTEHDEFDPSLWFLVERRGELVACALHWKETHGRGWVKDIVARESERGRGLGRAMLLHAFRVYKDRGATTVGLKVDATNPTGALPLYERVGFVTDQRYAIWTRRL